MGEIESAQQEFVIPGASEARAAEPVTEIGNEEHGGPDSVPVEAGSVEVIKPTPNEEIAYIQSYDVSLEGLRDRMAA